MGTAGATEKKQSTACVLRPRVGVVGGGATEVMLMQTWAQARGLGVRLLPFEPLQPLNLVFDLEWVLLIGDEHPILAIAECGRIRGALPHLRLIVLGLACEELRSAAARAGATFLPFSTGGSEWPWDALAELLFRPLHAPQLASLGSGLAVDRRAREVLVDGEHRRLTAIKFDILCYFLDNIGRAIPADELVRKGILLASQRSRYKCIVFELRRSLGSAADLIRVVPGYGYRMDASAELPKRW